MRTFWGSGVQSTKYVFFWGTGVLQIVPTAKMQTSKNGLSVFKVWRMQSFQFKFYFFEIRRIQNSNKQKNTRDTRDTRYTRDTRDTRDTKLFSKCFARFLFFRIKRVIYTLPCENRRFVPTREKKSICFARKPKKKKGYLLGKKRKNNQVSIFYCLKKTKKRETNEKKEKKKKIVIEPKKKNKKNRIIRSFPYFLPTAFLWYLMSLFL